MTYTPINWQTGDTITADKLNKMDNGWGITSTQLFSETVTTAAGEYGNYGTLAYATQMNAPSVIVTFDGTNYTCNAVELGGVAYYGGISGSGPDFSEYPFAIESAVSVGGPNGVYTQTAGTHSVSVAGAVMELSQSFADAVSSAMAMPIMQIEIGGTTWQEAHDAMAAGRLAFYVAVVDGDTVIQFVALRADYSDNNQRYEIQSVGTPTDGLAIRDVIYATSSSGPLLRN